MLLRMDEIGETQNNVYLVCTKSSSSVKVILIKKSPEIHCGFDDGN